MVLAGWSALSGARQLEADNDFCIGCHVNGAPLHRDQHRQLTDGHGGTLVAAHAGKTVRLNGPARPMRCIDCHRGADQLAQLKLDLIALRDLAVHLAGRGAEPDGLSMAIDDRVCLRCHRSVNAGRFHLINAHRGPLNVTCVECHSGHQPGRGPVATQPLRTERMCGRCHPGLAEGVRRVARGLPARPDAGSSAASGRR